MNRYGENICSNIRVLIEGDFSFEDFNSTKEIEDFINKLKRKIEKKIIKERGNIGLSFAETSIFENHDARKGSSFSIKRKVEDSSDMFKQGMASAFFTSRY